MWHTETQLGDIQCLPPTLHALHHAKASRAPAATLDVDSATIDARALFDSTTLRNQVHKLEKVELASVWRLTLQALSRQGAAGLQPLRV